jgi:hypothetical protein
VNMVINQPVGKRPFVMVEMKILHFG